MALQDSNCDTKRKHSNLPPRPDPRKYLVPHGDRCVLTDGGYFSAKKCKFVEKNQSASLWKRISYLRFLYPGMSKMSIGNLPEAGNTEAEVAMTRVIGLSAQRRTMNIESLSSNTVTMSPPNAMKAVNGKGSQFLES